jgi:hypothetical protein
VAETRANSYHPTRHAKKASLNGSIAPKVLVSSFAKTATKYLFITGPSALAVASEPT